MPILSNFFGIFIYMYWERQVRHHAPHFHAVYNEFECVFSLPDLSIMSGKLPARAEKMVTLWAKNHKTELLENWNRVMENMSLIKIEPLE